VDQLEQMLLKLLKLARKIKIEQEYSHSWAYHGTLGSLSVSGNMGCA